MGVSAGDRSTSSAQLKPVETSDSEGFWMKIGDFSVFLCFFTKTAASECVLTVGAMVVGTVDSIGGCDSKTAHNGALFRVHCSGAVIWQLGDGRGRRFGQFLCHGG